MTRFMRVPALVAAIGLWTTAAAEAQGCQKYDAAECESRTELDPESERVYACVLVAGSCRRGSDLGRGPTIMSPPVQLGALGARVRLLQSNLARTGVTVKVDGKFGPETKAAIEAFQKQQGLKVDGKVGPETWGRLSK